MRVTLKVPAPPPPPPPPPSNTSSIAGTDAAQKLTPKSPSTVAYSTSRGWRNKTASPSAPSRAVRPTLCTYVVGSDGGSTWTVAPTPEKSRPRAPTSVHRSTPAVALLKPW